MPLVSSFTRPLVSVPEFHYIYTQDSFSEEKKKNAVASYRSRIRAVTFVSRCKIRIEIITERKIIRGGKSRSGFSLA